MPIIERIVKFCCRHPALAVALSLAATLAAGWFTATHFTMNSDSAQLIASDVGWRQREIKYDAAFPQQSSLILVVVDGQTPELAEAATAALTAKLSQNPALFPSVRRPDGGDFFNHNGLLFLPLTEVQQTLQQLFRAQPFLGGMASDPSLRGVMGSLDTALLGVSSGQAQLADLDAPVSIFADSLSAAAHGQTRFLPWRSLVSGSPARPEELRRFITVKPKLNFEALEPRSEEH